jgi:uncharacterized membrane protein YkvA (DUF1232 family)
MKNLWQRIKTMAANLKQELKALRIALAEDLVPWYIKALIIFTVAYALSPVDLIPDFIPVLGLLDDLILLPLLIYIILKFIPKEVMTYCRKKAESTELSRKKIFLPALL